MPPNLPLVLLFLFVLRFFNWWIVVSFIRLPGTVAHELCHYFVGLLLNARPTRIVLWPVRAGNRIVLGEVSFQNLTWYNAALTGMAPLLLAPAAWSIISGPTGSGYHEVVMAWFEAVLLVSALPSATDFRIAFRFTAPPLLLVGLCLFWLARHG
ncbi:hypothetical protein [Ferrovum sp.]|uniref:hypothetical protein n=1 Tax=Ferrovum sp. TaxID=2609467 RepID=UPI00261AB37D|nr:hypothetical protein [Ferrovum sp.]